MKAKRSHWYILSGTNDKITRVPRRLLARLLWRWRHTRIPSFQGQQTRPKSARFLGLAPRSLPTAMPVPAYTFYRFWVFEDRNRISRHLHDPPYENLTIIKLTPAKAARLKDFQERVLKPSRCGSGPHNAAPNNSMKGNYDGYS